jgi:hypothetical protein
MKTRIEPMRFDLALVVVVQEQKRMRKLTKDDYLKLQEKAEEVKINATSSSTDDAVRQHVFTMFDSHWLFTYFRTVDDLCEDTWSCVISRIEMLQVDLLTIDSPVCSNVLPRQILDNDGTKHNVQIVVENEEDD